MIAAGTTRTDQRCLFWWLLLAARECVRAAAAAAFPPSVTAEDLEVGRSVAAVVRLRGRVQEALEAAEDGRVALHRAFLQAQPMALAEAGGYSDADFLYMAWLHAGLRCLDEVGRGWAAGGRVA